VALEVAAAVEKVMAEMAVVVDAVDKHHVLQYIGRLRGCQLGCTTRGYWTGVVCKLEAQAVN
jgi:hypothetical protein